MYLKQNQKSGKPVTQSPVINRRPPQKKKISSLNPDMLVKKAMEVNEETYAPGRSYEDMPLTPAIKSILEQKGYTHPTEIQDKAIEKIMEGNDLLGIAKTGTGKTAAFLLPIIHRLETTHKQQKFQSLVIVPTRELAVQVEQEFRSLTTGLHLRSICCIGGTSVNTDMQQLSRPLHLIVGTPGRLMDLYNRAILDFSRFEVLVLDEFDKMLDMGFVKDVERIAALMTARKQTLLFSATINKAQQPVIDKLLRKPVVVKVSTGEASSDHIDQNIVKVGEHEDKFVVLCKMLKQREFEKVLIFAETKRGVSRLCKKLKNAGISADEIHGDKAQNYRLRALDKFRAGLVKVLVATDVAARGLDITDVSHVINYQMPMSLDSYIHRIGRTGRAGKSGIALTFV